MVSNQRREVVLVGSTDPVDPALIWFTLYERYLEPS
jgi:hypothetical protein